VPAQTDQQEPSVQEGRPMMRRKVAAVGLSAVLVMGIGALAGSAPAAAGVARPHPTFFSVTPHPHMHCREAATL
jgi:hypothetical protein